MDARLHPPPETSALDLPGIRTDAASIAAARHANAPNRLWIVDVSQVWAGTCWLYFGFVLDSHSRRCHGWFPHRVPHRELVVEALKVAVAEPQATAGSRLIALVFGSHCRTAGVEFPHWAIPSGSDAALAAAFTASLRAALHERDGWEWVSHTEARQAIGAWITDEYNAKLRRRLFAPTPAPP